MDIRVGVITKAWEHEEADKLFCEEIDIGEDEPRQIASGLKAHYNVDDLVGQRVLVLANLKARKLVGFPSHGMVMCAVNEDGSKVEFVEPPEGAEIGERVMVEGFDGEPVRLCVACLLECVAIIDPLAHVHHPFTLRVYLSTGNRKSSHQEEDARRHLSRSQDEWRWRRNIQGCSIQYK